MGRKKKNINIIDNINMFINKENEKQIIEKIKLDFIKNLKKKKCFKYFCFWIFFVFIFSITKKSKKKSYEK